MYPKPYLEFLVYFHGSRDYFECHEVLEEYWKDVENGQKESVWVGLIQLAVGLYHYRRKNIVGAKRMLSKAMKLIEQTKHKLKNLAIDPIMLNKIVKQLLHDIEQQHPFYDIDLPISDDKLVKLCKDLCAEQGFQFGQKSDFTNQAYIHKHKLRDRQEVILERERRLNENKKRRRFAD